MIKIPIRWRRGGLFNVIRASRTAHGFDGLDQLDRLVDNTVRPAGKDARCSAERIVLVASQQVTEGENHTEQHDKQDKNSDKLASAEYPILVASIARCHQRFGSSVFCTQALMMSMGSGKTMVVFFSAPISVSV